METKMAIKTQTIMRLAAVLALTGACASSFAQSNEYRRGYEDGFAAGQRAASEPGRRPDWGRVHVEEAMYGARGAVCDARRAVHEAIERNGGLVHVGNELCGDPARGEQKRLRIIYRCGDSEPVRTVAGENETLRLSCRR
jgi:hypothetical protein